MPSIIFVCHGNICRSPMAEFVMKKMVRDFFGNTANDARADARATGLTEKDFQIASAATSTEEIGNPVYPPARRLLNARGIDCSGHAARQFNQQDYDRYDYVVLMDRNNLRNLRWNINAESYEKETARGIDGAANEDRKVSLLMDWTSRPGDVADPWYTGDFEATWRDVNEGCRGLLDEIMAKALAGAWK